MEIKKRIDSSIYGSFISWFLDHQKLHLPIPTVHGIFAVQAKFEAVATKTVNVAVSYTHLTLPTKRIV